VVRRVSRGSPYTTVAIKSKTKIVGRVYCRNTKLRTETRAGESCALSGSKGLTERVYNRRPHAVGALARKIGVSATDAHSEPLDVSLDELLAVPRSACSTERLATAAAPTP
jgi:hypothetical protein